MIIDELSSLPLPVQSTDELPIERGELAYKVTYNNLVGSEIAGVKSNITTLQGNVTTLQNADSKIESGIAIIVSGDRTAMAVPVGGYAYIKDNTHGLAEGLYTNTSSAAFPASGGTADGTVFTAVSGGGLNAIQQSLANVGVQVAQFSTLDADGSINLSRTNYTALSAYGEGLVLLPYVRPDNNNWCIRVVGAGAYSGSCYVTYIINT